MSVFWFSFNAIAPLMLLVLLGIVLRRIGLINESLNSGVNRLLFQTAFPISLFYNIAGMELSEFFSLRLMLFALISIISIAALLMLVVPRVLNDRRKSGAFIQGVYRGNYLLLGYPLARNLFGENGIGPTAMLLPLVIALYNVLAVFILEYFSDGSAERIRWSRIFVSVLKNPLIIGAAAGVIFAALPISLPPVLGRTARDIAGIANPLALIMLGSQINANKMNGRLKLVFSATVLRLMIIPVIVVSIAVLAGFRDSELGALYILFCAPTAVSSYIMAKNMNSDSDLAAQIIVATTALSGISLFVFTFTLRSLSLI